MSEAVFPDDIIEAQEKRIEELETALTEIRYIADGAIKIQPIYAIADSALSEGGADE